MLFPIGIALEEFSKPLMPCLDYERNDIGEMKVAQENAHFYKYLDLRVQTEVLFDCIRQTMEEKSSANWTF